MEIQFALLFTDKSEWKNHCSSILNFTKNQLPVGSPESIEHHHNSVWPWAQLVTLSQYPHCYPGYMLKLFGALDVSGLSLWWSYHIKYKRVNQAICHKDVAIVICCKGGKDGARDDENAPSIFHQDHKAHLLHSYCHRPKNMLMLNLFGSSFSPSPSSRPWWRMTMQFWQAEMSNYELKSIVDPLRSMLVALEFWLETGGEVHSCLACQEGKRVLFLSTLGGIIVIFLLILQTLPSAFFSILLIVEKN